MIELLKEPWPWYISGPVISLVMLLLIFFGKSFGVSSNLRTICAIGGAGKYSDFFKFDWRAQKWNLVFILGSVLGGFIASEFMHNGEPIKLSDSVLADFKAMGINNPGQDILPNELFGTQALFSLKGISMLVIGGLLIGFGTRYAGGCTSGHAISGLSNLQLPSLVAVIGFFIGGLIMTYLILPYILHF